MRRKLGILAVVLMAGAAGALLAGSFSTANGARAHGDARAAADAHAEPTKKAAREAPRVIVPPLWNEGRTGARESLRAAEDHRPPELVNRENQRLGQYQKELANREQYLAAHAREPVDPDWSKSASEQLTQVVSATRRPMQNREVDCRSKTCVVSLTFAAPNEALAYLGSADTTKLGRGMSGLLATPTPPNGDGPYTLSILLKR